MIPNSMNFDDAVEEILSYGYPLKSVYRMKCKHSKLPPILPEGSPIDKYGVFPVRETAKDTVASYTENGKIENGASPIPYKTDEGNLLNDNEFWIPCVMDGYHKWRKYHCAPHWIKCPEKQSKFCYKHYKKSTQVTGGEWAVSPSRWLSSEKTQLKILRKAPSFTPERHRDKLTAQLEQDREAALSYLCHATELILSFAPQYRQVSYENLMGDECVSSDIDPMLPRIIELAFKAGRLTEKSELHYRGTPRIAEAGEAFIRSQGKGRPTKGKKAKKAKVYKWKKIATPILKDDPNYDRRSLLGHLVTQLAIVELQTGVYQEVENKGYARTFSEKAFYDKISKLLKSDYFSEF